MLRIGITGGLGSGKSTAANFFGARGAYVFDADMEAKLILLRNQFVQQEVIDTFGEPILNEVGEIDFTRLAKYAFDSQERQHTLNDIIHPEVIVAAEQAMTDAHQREAVMFVMDVPLLFEAHIEQYLDYTIAIIADEALRIQRALERGTLTKNEILRRTRLQLSDEERAAKADFVVDNSGSLNELHQQLQEIYDILIGTGSS